MPSNKLTKTLKNQLYTFEKSNDLCLSLNEKAQRSSYCAYITFENEYSYRQCLVKLQNLELLTYFLQPNKYKMDGQTVFVRVRIFIYIYLY
jgi:hypothetical protein